jgi:hypothetical protein
MWCGTVCSEPGHAFAIMEGYPLSKEPGRKESNMKRFFGRLPDEASWRYSEHGDQDGGLSQVPDDGCARRQKQRRTGQVRHQEPHSRCRNGARGSQQTAADKLLAR